MSAPVDRAWLHGRVFTGIAFAEAFLVEGGEIVAVGADDAVRRAAGVGTEKVDLHGRLVLPGLIDLHMHLTDTLLQREGVDLHGTRSLDELAARIRSAPTKDPTGPVIGVGWDCSRWPDPHPPTRTELDRIVSDRPMVLFQGSMHGAALNSLALELLGLNEREQDPPGGRFGRDSAGRLNGLLYDAAMARLSETPAGDARTRPDVSAYQRLLAYAATLGLTTLCPVLSSPAEIATVAALPAAEIPVRLRFYLTLRALDRYASLPRPASGAMWRITGVKAITDGAFGTRTAWLREPYSDDPGNAGFPIGSDDELRTALVSAAEVDLALALHAIGDRALERVLRILAAVPRTAAPPRIEHASMTPPDLWPELERLRPSLVVEPHFVETDHWLVDRIGPDRAQWTYAFRTLTDRGFMLGGASDSPVEPLDPWTGIRAAVGRAPRSPFGQLTARERLAPIEAFQLYTRNAGPILGEPQLGQIVLGGPADFVLTPVTSLDAALSGNRPPVVETWVAGHRRFPASAA